MSTAWLQLKTKGQRYQETGFRTVLKTGLRTSWDMQEGKLHPGLGGKKHWNSFHKFWSRFIFPPLPPPMLRSSWLTTVDLVWKAALCHGQCLSRALVPRGVQSKLHRLSAEPGSETRMLRQENHLSRAVHYWAHLCEKAKPTAYKTVQKVAHPANPWPTLS